MHVREWMEQNQKTVAAIAAGIVVLVGVVICLELRTPSTVAATSGQAYFTIDDGVTWFADDGHRVPPFIHDGKEAVLCFVYDTGGARKVVYLQKFAPEAKTALEAEQNNKSATAVAGGGLQYLSGTLVKQPGDKAWVTAMSPAGRTITAMGVTGQPVTP